MDVPVQHFEPNLELWNQIYTILLILLGVQFCTRNIALKAIRVLLHLPTTFNLDVGMRRSESRHILYCSQIDSEAAVFVCFDVCKTMATIELEPARHENTELCTVP